MVTEHCTTAGNTDYKHNNVELAINRLHKSHVNKATNEKVKHTRNINNRPFLNYADMSLTVTTSCGHFAEMDKCC